MWRFDPYSALIGAGLTLVLFGLWSLLQEPLRRRWKGIQEALRKALGRATAGMEARYRERVARWAQAAHALAQLGPLEQFFVPPLLLPPLPPPDPEQEGIPERVPLPVEELLKGPPRLAIAGGVASGRTTLLAYLALTQASGTEGSSRLPLYLYLPALAWPLPEDPKADPLEPLIREATGVVGALPATGSVLRQAVRTGRALVLADGWDELPPEARPQAAAWLAGLADAFPGNIWIVATGPQNYAPLTGAGFVPLRLLPWESAQMRDFLTRLPTPEPFPVEEALGRLMDLRDRTGSLLDVALCALALLEGEAPPRRSELYRRRVDRWESGVPAPPQPSGRGKGRSEASEKADEARASEERVSPRSPRRILSLLALRMQEEGRAVLSHRELEEAVRELLFADPEVERPRPLVAWALQALRGSRGADGGMPFLVPCGSDRYAFAHPLWQAFMAAEEIAAGPPDPLLRHLEDPRWMPVVEFYAEGGGMEAVVNEWLARPDDLWRTRLCRAARWVALAPSGAPWRNGVMALLGRSLLSPELPEPVRWDLLRALVRTGDPGVPLFLRHALQHPQEEIRALAARAMGLLRERADLSGLIRALGDASERVRKAAVDALGAIGTPGAVEALTQVLMEGDEFLQAEAARGLARTGEVGEKVLQEAMGHEDFLVRRAAAYGLAEIRARWAREMLERAIREDREWIVRSAASTALAEQDRQAVPTPPQPPPVVSEMGWLIAWAAERGEGVGLGDAAFGPLLEALREGSVPIRLAAVQTLGLVGRPEHAAALQQALSDPAPEVAQAAFQALRELSLRWGLLAAEPL